jgi:hypothetical protein
MNDQRGSIFNINSIIHEQNVHSVFREDERKALLDELERLREAVLRSDEPIDRKNCAAREIDAAIDATRQSDKKKAKDHLQNIGRWIVNFCSNVGANIVSTLIAGR